MNTNIPHNPLENHPTKGVFFDFVVVGYLLFREDPLRNHKQNLSVTLTDHKSIPGSGQIETHQVEK